jgi:esterase/lipase
MNVTSDVNQQPMSNYSSLVDAIVREVRAEEDALSLMDETCHSLFLLHPEPTPKVLLFFHGFTATPAQFKPIARICYKAGYNVLVPLLPGHGLAGNWSSSSPPPLPETQQEYLQFGQHWLKQVQPLGEQVFVGGLSGGSTLAAWLAIECAELIDRALLFAPYLSNSNIVVDLFVRIFNVYFEWKLEPGLAHFGYDGFLMPSLRVFLDMGQDVLDRAKTKPAAPMLIVSSESDRAVNFKDHQALFESVLKYQPKAWYHCFDQVLDIPHNMMTRAEGNQCFDLLLAIAKAYVESDLTWAEVLQIRDRIAQGFAFDAAVQELGLSDRTSPELLTLVTMKNN